MEWLNDLFGDENKPPQFRPDEETTQHSKASTVKQRFDDLANVLKEIDPDLVVVVEGPSRPQELQLFFDRIGTGTWATYLQISSPKQTQNIGIAARTDTGKFELAPYKTQNTVTDTRFDPFQTDTDEDDLKEQHRFERRPLYVEVHPAGGRAFQILGLHLKSKGIFDALEWSKWWAKADANRKKIIAQAMQIRTKFLDSYLTDAKTKDIPLIVCGDINDGPGLDASEKKLYNSGIESLMGNVWKPELCLGNAIFDALKPKDQQALNFSSIYTTSYRDPIFDGMYQKEWIDHILYSKVPVSKWVQNARIHGMMSGNTPIWKKYPHGSDHFPASVEITT